MMPIRNKKNEAKMACTTVMSELGRSFLFQFGVFDMLRAKLKLRRLNCR